MPLANIIVYASGVDASNAYALRSSSISGATPRHTCDDALDNCLEAPSPFWAECDELACSVGTGSSGNATGAYAIDKLLLATGGLGTSRD